ncbi:YidH family protein [Flavobacterium foetidum]|uniref:YidH family protein n=1 Tax=Flavobacterium foetidum TaxID=2026681 RepID=UPI0010751462|nr:DUF202 domain-containing protein [Flavobacterium foetidum]KAF2517179.1 DUF202 domain-containing protein [Flavobacterium foetidum]
MKPNNDEEIMNELLSNERTLLSWIRTGIGIMVFGFVAVKFSLFIKQLPAKYIAETVAPDSNFTVYLGIGLLITGALTILLSFLRYRKTVQLLKEGRYQYSTAMLTFITMMIFMISILLIAYLVAAAVK